MATGASQIDEFRLETEFEEDNVVVHRTRSVHGTENQEVEAELRWRTTAEIGSGAFGTVHLQTTEKGEKRAVKELFKHILKNAKIDISRELQALIDVREHRQYFVEFLGWYENKQYIYLTMEYMEAGDLGGYLKNFGPEAQREAREITRQIAEGIAILHKKRICHRDLKPQNVLVASTSPIWVKIADFGVCKPDKGTTLKTVIGTLNYQAPELLGLVPMPRGRSYTRAIDLWSLGCLIYEILTLKAPFHSVFPISGSDWSHTGGSQHNMNLLKDYCNGECELPTELLQESNVEDEGIGFIKALLVANPSSRMSADEVLTCPWLERWEGNSEDLRIRLQILGIEFVSPDTADRLIFRGQGAHLVQVLSSAKLWGGCTEKQYYSIFKTLLQATDTIDFRVMKSWTLLQLVAEDGHRGLMETLLNCGADVNAEPGILTGRTALQAAAGKGHMDLVKLLLDRGAKINAEAAYGDGRTALQAAAESGHMDIAVLLLDNGADVNAKPKNFTTGRTALQAAAGEGHMNLVKLLLDRGAKINTEAAYGDGRTALQAAAESGHMDIAVILLDNGADDNAWPAEVGGRTALQAAAGKGYMNLVKLLLDRGAKINAKAAYKDGRTALQAAAESGHMDIAVVLLDNGADDNAWPAEVGGRTALQAAAGKGYMNLVNLLLDLGADVNATAALVDGRTALQAAAESGHMHIVVILLDQGADVNAWPAEVGGRTALQAAAEEGHLGLVKLLLDHGANTNAIAALKDGRTALQAAAGGGKLDVAEILLERGANVNANPAKRFGMTALAAASRAGHLDLVRLLLDHGANINACQDQTALEVAAEYGHVDIVKLLLFWKAHINFWPSRDAPTAIELAEHGAHSAVVKLLQDAVALQADGLVKHSEPQTAVSYSGPTKRRKIAQ